ncbi:tyrosine-type recombinase/integrase [Vibrio cholerae]|uniref:tyrosine-type recombinase/integrase n=2 Tax=Vibrio cholerae TaxID=666 RepID=UPI0021AE8DF1|nr:site-specific integrase [Vibrio cholerae]
MYPEEKDVMGKLYDKHLKAVLNKSHLKVFTLTDGDGLGARVSLQGNVRWQFRYKINGASKRVDLGDYPDLSLLKAREEAQKCREWLAEGHDPKLQRSVIRQETLKPVSVQDALEYWLVEYAESNRANADKHRSQFQKHIYPYIGALPLAQTETHHWIECFDRVRKGIAGKQRPAPVAAGYVLQNAKQALRFCRVRRYATSRVLDDLTVNDVGKKQRKKDRVLTAQELSDLWNAVQTPNKFLPYYCHLVKFLIVFGARTQEVRLSKWKEWDFETLLWTVPKEHSKTDEKIIRPIPDELVPWLLQLKAGSDKEALILGEEKSPETVSQQGRFFWQRLGHEEAWTLHDIRRTLATRLNELGVAPYVVEQLLGHSLGGVMAIYNRSQYLPEKREGLTMWLEHLDILTNKTNNVTSIISSKRTA